MTALHTVSIMTFSNTEGAIWPSSSNPGRIGFLIPAELDP